MDLTKKQIETFQENRIDEFVNLTVIFIQNNFNQFSSDKSLTELKAFVYSIVKFCKSCGIYGGLNLQKMTHYFIEFNLTIPVDGRITSVLKQQRLNEDIKVQNFYLILASGRYKLKEITLV